MPGLSLQTLAQPRSTLELLSAILASSGSGTSDHVPGLGSQTLAQPRSTSELLSAILALLTPPTPTPATPLPTPPPNGQLRAQNEENELLRIQANENVERQIELLRIQTDEDEARENEILRVQAVHFLEVQENKRLRAQDKDTAQYAVPRAGE